MRIPATSAWRAVIIGLVLCHAIAAASQVATSSYSEAIELYRQGEEQRALTKLAGLTVVEVTRGQEALFTALASKRPGAPEHAAATIRGAVMLHTARAFSAFERNNNGEFRIQLAFAQAYVD